MPEWLVGIAMGVAGASSVWCAWLYWELIKALIRRGYAKVD